MAIPYAQWLKALGLTSTTANAAKWKTTHGVALGLYNPDGTPKTAAPGAPATGAPPPVTAAATPAATPTPPPPLPDLRIPHLQANLQAIPGRFNDRRRGSALDALRQLISTGLIESGSLGEERAASGIAGADGADQPNIVYKLIVGPGGKLYRQAYQGTVAAQNARGMLESSQTNQRLQEGKSALDTNVNDAIHVLTRSNTQSLDDQRTATRGVEGEITGVKQDAAQRAQDAWQPPTPPVPVVPPIPVAAGLAAPTPKQPWMGTKPAAKRSVLPQVKYSVPVRR